MSAAEPQAESESRQWDSWDYLCGMSSCANMTGVTVSINSFTANQAAHFDEFLDKVFDFNQALAKQFAFAYFMPYVDDCQINCGVQDIEDKVISLLPKYMTTWNIEVSGYHVKTYTNAPGH
jgi:hypothetical protein